MSDSLPEPWSLPDPWSMSMLASSANRQYSAEQMRAYGDERAARERERCAMICERLASVLSGPDESDGEYAPMMACAAAIRKDAV